MWLLLKNLSRQNHKILLETSHKAAILSDDIAVYDGWSIPSTFPQRTVKQLEIIQELLLSEVSKLNDVVRS